MTNKMTILILDENQYFATGLRHILSTWFQKNGSTVQFLGPEDDADHANLVFFTPQNISRLPPRLLQSHSSDRRLIFIASRRYFRGKVCPGLPHISMLHRESLRQDVPLLLCSSGETNISPKDLLSPREREVLGHLSLSGAKTGKVMGISAKTVSAHKYRATEKMGITSPQGLFLWITVFAPLLQL